MSNAGFCNWIIFSARSEEQVVLSFSRSHALLWCERRVAARKAPAIECERNPFVRRPLCYYVKRDDHFSFSWNNGSVCVFFNAPLNGQYLFSCELSGGTFRRGCGAKCAVQQTAERLVADRGVDASFNSGWKICVLHHGLSVKLCLCAFPIYSQTHSTCTSKYQTFTVLRLNADFNKLLCTFLLFLYLYWWIRHS